MPLKLLIWDWNGTILDDTRLCIDIENELLRERGMPEITEAWYLSHFTFPVRRYYAKMGYTFETESFESGDPANAAFRITAGRSYGTGGATWRRVLLSGHARTGRYPMRIKGRSGKAVYGAKRD